MSKTLKVCPSSGAYSAGTYKGKAYRITKPFSEIDYELALDLISGGIASLVTRIGDKSVEQISASTLKTELEKRNFYQKSSPVFQQPVVQVISDKSDTADLVKAIEEQKAVIEEQKAAIEAQKALIEEQKAASDALISRLEALEQAKAE